ncbi:MAG: hypothetical protein ACF8PN_02345 [Phycisphaerales bacterium]
MALSPSGVGTPPAVLNILERKGAQVTSVRSAVAAMAEIARFEIEHRRGASGAPRTRGVPIALLIVEPEQFAGTGKLRDAIRRHFPLVAVWACRDHVDPRLAPLDEPAAPDHDASRDEMVADLHPRPRRIDDSAGDEPPSTFTRGSVPPSLRLAPETAAGFGDGQPSTPSGHSDGSEDDDELGEGVVSPEELSMLLRPDPSEDEDESSGSGRRGAEA